MIELFHATIWIKVASMLNNRSKTQENTYHIIHSCVCQSLNRAQVFATPWTVAHQAPLSMGFSRQEYWSELPFPSPGDLLDSGIGPGSPALQADSLPSEVQGKPNPLTQSSKTDNLLCQRSEQWKEHSVTLGRRVRVLLGFSNFQFIELGGGHTAVFTLQ